MRTNQPTQAANQPPALAPRAAAETAADFGRRAFEYLIADRYRTGMLSDDALESALHFSGYVVTARDMAESVRDRCATIRLDLARSIAARKAAAAEREREHQGAAAPPSAPSADDSSNGGRGKRVALPTPPRPLAPTGSRARPF